MFSLSKKSKFPVIALLVITLAATAYLMAGKSDASAVYGRTCDLAVFPYNPDAPELIGAAGQPFINELNDANCRRHLTVTSQYQPQPPPDFDTPVLPGAENRRVPITLHEHAYFNASAEDPSFYLKSAVDRFEIKLHPDAFDNTFINNLTCFTPIPPGVSVSSDLFDCNGTDNNLYGGTRITKVTNYSTRTVTITWFFGINESGRKPQIYGVNGRAFVTYNESGAPFPAVDLTNPYNRKLEFRVNLTSKNNSSRIWSATTTSRALIANLYIRRSNYPRNNRVLRCPDLTNPSETVSGWCYFEPDSSRYTTETVVTPSGPHTYFWFPIAGVGTVWKKPPPPPPPAPPTLKLVKRVVNTGGGTLTVNDFPLLIDGRQVTNNVDNNVTVGNHVATETTQPNYTPSTWSGDCRPDGSVTIRAGDHKTCIITNVFVPPPREIPPKLKLIKRVINTGGGTLTVADFPLFVSGRPVVSEVVNTLTPGNHLASETNQPHYLASAWSGDCSPDGSVSLRNGDDKTCIITNTFVPPPLPGKAKLILRKEVDNSDGGTLTVVDFPLFLNGKTVVSGAVNVVEPGDYVARETTRPGYDPSSWFLDCEVDGSITLNDGDIKECLIINKFVPVQAPPATLTLVKTVIGGTSTVNDFDFFITGMTTTGTTVSVTTEHNLSNTLLPGTYRVSESTVAGYTASAWTGIGCGADGTVSLAEGENKTCSITNTFSAPVPPTLRVVKIVVNSGPGLGISDFPLFIDGSSTTSGAEVILSAGQHTVTEINQPGYQASYSPNCLNGIITLNAGERAICTITNVFIPPQQQLPTLTLVKTVNGGGPLGVSNFPLSVNGNIPMISGIPMTLAPNDYTATEISQPNYSRSPWTGDCSPDGRITLSMGDLPKTCYITNTFIPVIQPNTTLTVVKSVINGGVGTLTVSDFSLFIDGNIVTSGIPRNVSPGSHFVSETNRPGYTSTIGGDCDANGNVFVPQGQSRTCIITNVFQAPPQPPPSPLAELRKTSFRVMRNGNRRGNIIRENQLAEFEIVFSPIRSVIQATITDTIRISQKLFGSYGGVIDIERGIYSGRDFTVLSRHRLGTGSTGTEIIACPSATTSSPTCYTGSPFNSSGITIRNLNTDNEVVIRYTGKLTSTPINDEFCRRITVADNILCGEAFTNRAVARFDSAELSASDTLFTPCPFFVAQGVGDVILEQNLRIGGDIRSCGPPNIIPPVIIPPGTTTQPTPRTGRSATLNIPSHRICNQSGEQGVNGLQSYDNPVKRLSSAVCEIQMSLARALEKPRIKDDVRANIARITRNNNNLDDGGGNVEISDLNRPLGIPSTNRVYKAKNRNVVLNSMMPVSETTTYVVENGDLIINNNIKYAETNFSGDFRRVPSIAFIVINGNIKIAPNVEKLVGVYVALNIDKNGTGEIQGTAPSDEPKSLTINGAVLGDIEPLFENRSGFFGDPSMGQGAVVINYDGRLFYNIPPGLKEIIDIEPQQVAR